MLGSFRCGSGFPPRSSAVREFGTWTTLPAQGNASRGWESHAVHIWLCHAHLAASPAAGPRAGSRASGCKLSAAAALGYCFGNLAEQYNRAAKPPRAVDLGSLYWRVSRLGCVGGKLPISRDCVSRKGSYWNSKPLPPL